MPVTECECAGVVEQKHCTTLACSTSSSCLQWVPWEQSPCPVLVWCAQTFGTAAAWLGLNRQLWTVGSENSVCYCLFC